MKQSTKKHCKSFLALFLTVAILVGGAFAFLAATDSRNNVFTIGSVAIELNEEGWIETENGKWTKSDGTSANIVPGAEIEKAPTVKNTGIADAWVYLTVGVPTAQGTNGKVSAIDTTELQMPVNAYAIQDGYEENFTSEAVWSAYFDAEEIFGAPLADASDRVELFDIYTGINLNELGLGWELLSATPYSVDGYNYYTYVYQSKLTPNSETSALFESVVYGADVVDVSIAAYDTFNGTDTPVPEDYVPQDGDEIILGGSGDIIKYTTPSWQVIGNIDSPTPKGDIPTEIYGSEVKDMEPYFKAKVVDGVEQCIVGKNVRIKRAPSQNVIYGLNEKLTKEQLLYNYLDYYKVEVEITDNDPTTQYLGAGSTVTVTWNKGTAEETQEIYTIIIFGDVNGDSVVSMTDADMVFRTNVGEASPLTGVAKIAGNIEGTVFSINENDTDFIKRHVLYNSNKEKYANYADSVINQKTGFIMAQS